MILTVIRGNLFFETYINSACKTATPCSDSVVFISSDENRRDVLLPSIVFARFYRCPSDSFVLVVGLFALFIRAPLQRCAILSFDRLPRVLYAFIIVRFVSLAAITPRSCSDQLSDGVSVLYCVPMAAVVSGTKGESAKENPGGCYLIR